jgi:hypothetical protein
VVEAPPPPVPAGPAPPEPAVVEEVEVVEDVEVGPEVVGPEVIDEVEPPPRPDVDEPAGDTAPSEHAPRPSVPAMRIFASLTFGVRMRVSLSIREGSSSEKRSKIVSKVVR